MSLFHLFKEFRRRDWLLAGFSLVFMLIQVWMDLNLPAYMSKITMLLQTAGTGMHELLRAGGVMLLYALGSLLASCATAFCVSALSFSFGGSLRSRLFHQVMAFSMAESDIFSPASLITRSTNDITQVQSFMVMGLQVIVKAPLTAIGAIGKVSGMVWQWTTVTVVGTVLIVVLVTTCVFLILPRQKRVQKLTDDMNRIADTNLIGISVIHAYNAEETAEEKFSSTNEEMTRNNLYAIRAMAVMSPSVQLVLNGMTLAIYWIGAVLIDQSGTLEQAGLFSNMLAFAQYATQIVNAFVTLTMVFTMIPRVMVSSRRIDEVLKTEPSVKDEGTESSSEETGTLEFRHVDFCYPGETKPAVQDITFTASKGETVAVIGSTGSGKSTVVNLIPRLYDVSSGEILIDGINIKKYSLKALRDKIGYCPQQSVLLSGTVRSNVCFGSETPAETIKTAMQTAQAKEFVDKMNGGLDAPVMQGGANLSGGQKQRLSVARALEKSPEILVLDDTGSALDYQTESELRKDLSENYSGTTKIVVTQRIGSVRDADRILVMDDGKIVGQGTHKELLQSCEVYQQIAETQKEEAAL